MFNNIKESTPNFMKTIAYSQTVKPVLGRRPQVSWRMTRDPSFIRMMRWIHRKVICNTLNYQLLFIGVAYAVFAGFFYPSLWAYQANNRHRQLDFALLKENEYKRQKELAEAADEEGEEEAGEENAAAEEDQADE